VKGPDALLSRINAFLTDIYEMKIKALTAEELDISRKALIKSLE
jgi:secreted Zn-dependent insulinase-like peptidase